MERNCSDENDPLIVTRKRKGICLWRNILILILLLLTLICLIYLIVLEVKVKECQKDSLKEEYDFIVIGLGAGGSVIASRLSQISQITVLGVDGGPNEMNYVKEPKKSSYSFISPHDPSIPM